MSDEDSILKEIRVIRDTQAAKFNYDVDAIFDDLERRERESGCQFIPYISKKTEDAKTSAGRPDVPAA